MAAAVLAALDVPTSLLTNDVGDDEPGSRVNTQLQRYGVPPPARMTGMPTPQIVVVADEQPTRTWIPYLPGVADALAALDLTPLVNAAYAYIDCYQIIEAPAVRAIQAARATGVPLLLNLGGSPLSRAVVAAVHGYPHLTVQTNVDDADHADASHVAASILTATGAAWTIVRAGAHGAVALSRTEHLHAPAFLAMIRHTHCAGAAFSGGLLYGLLHDRPMSESLIWACASGALRCERAYHEPIPTLPELRAFIGSHERTRGAATRHDGAMTQLGDEELWAQACIQQALLDARVEQHDDGSRPGMYDLRIVYPDDSVAAVEVTIAGDPKYIELGKELDRKAKHWHVAGLRGSWWIRVLPSARLRELRQQLPDILRSLELDDVRNIRGNRSSPNTLVKLIGKLNILLQQAVARPATKEAFLSQSKGHQNRWEDPRQQRNPTSHLAWRVAIRAVAG